MDNIVAIYPLHTINNIRQIDGGTKMCVHWGHNEKPHVYSIEEHELLYNDFVKSYVIARKE